MFADKGSLKEPLSMVYFTEVPGDQSAELCKGPSQQENRNLRGSMLT